MKKNYLLLLILFITGVSHAQLKFETSSLQDVLAKAKKENKLIFLQLESSQCNQCNEVADKAFEKPFPDSIKKNFVFFKLAASSSDRIEIDRKFNTKNSSLTLFLNTDGNLVHRYNKTTTRAESYFEECSIALQKGNNFHTISDLDKMYKSGNRDIAFLEKYLTSLKELNLSTDKLLDEYVMLIPRDSVRSVRTLQFIASIAPLINSRADTVLRHDRILYNQMMNRLPATQRTNLHHGIVQKSIKKTIETKDLNYQVQVANFAKSINTNAAAAQRIYDHLMLNYYKGINDTAMYINNAIPFYDKYFMTISLEQVLETDSARRKAMFYKAPVDTVNLGEGIIHLQRSITFSPQTQSYANELNSAAWSLYKMSNDPAVLNKALEWTKKALEFNNSPGIIDTYARLLYKTGNKPEAIKQEEIAIAMEKKKGFTAAVFERVLKRMKENASVVDDN